MGLCFGTGCHRGGRRDQGDVEDDGLPEHSWTSDDHCCTWSWWCRWIPEQKLNILLKNVKMHVSTILLQMELVVPVDTRTETEHSVKKCEDACLNYLATNVGITFAYSWACFRK